MNAIEIPYRIVVLFAGDAVRTATTELKDLNGVVVDVTNSVASLTKTFNALSSMSGPKSLLDASNASKNLDGTPKLSGDKSQPTAGSKTQDEPKKSEPEANVEPWLKGDFGMDQTKARKQLLKTKDQLEGMFSAENERLCDLGEPTAALDAEREKTMARINAALEVQKFLVTDLGQELQKVGQQAVTQFGSGLSKAFGQVIQGTKDAKTAFMEFGRTFLDQISQMIMQALILAAIKAALDGTKLGGILFPGKAAEGTLTPRLAAAGALNGVQTVSTATWFPAFNTIAGEAGTEVLAVLSRPRLMDLGGLATYVGQVQGHDLAMTDARELQSAIGSRQSAIAGGRIEIAITMSPEVEARVLRNSVEQAVVEINTALSTDSPTSAAVKSLTA